MDLRHACNCDQGKDAAAQNAAITRKEVLPTNAQRALVVCACATQGPHIITKTRHNFFMEEYCRHAHAKRNDVDGCRCPKFVNYEPVTVTDFDCMAGCCTKDGCNKSLAVRSMRISVLVQVMCIAVAAYWSASL